MDNKLKIALMSTLLSIGFVQADTNENNLNLGQFEAQVRTFWFDGRRALRSDRTALSFGGVYGYKSPTMYGFGVDTAWYLSVPISPFATMPESAATQNIKSDGTTISTIAELSLNYLHENTLIKIGRQRLNLPITNDYYNRMLPNSFEALSIEDKTIRNMTLNGAYITGWKYKNSDTFISPTHNFGVDRNIAVIGGEYQMESGLKIELYDTYVADVINAPFLQLSHKIALSDESTLSSGLQYLSQTSVGTQALGSVDTFLLGLKSKYSYQQWSVTALFTTIGAQSLVGTGGDYESSGWSQFITYTDIQIDGESENSGAIAYGVILGYNLSNSLNIELKYIYTNQNDNIQSATNSLTSNPRADSNEYDIDTTYRYQKNFSLRARVGYIDYISDSTSLYQTKAYDEVNLRVIADYFFRTN